MVIPSGNRICLAGDWRIPLFSRETKNKLSEVPCIFFPKPRPPTTPLPLDSLSPEFGGDAQHPFLAAWREPQWWRRCLPSRCSPEETATQLLLPLLPTSTTSEADGRHPPQPQFQVPRGSRAFGGGLYDIIFPIGSMISNSKYIKYTLVIALISRRSG